MRQARESLVAPDDDAWREAFGVAPSDEEITGDDLVREVKIEVGTGLLLHLTWGVVESSVRVRWMENDVRVVDVFREQASAIRIESPERGTTQLRVVFTGAVTDLLVTVWPRFRLEDVPLGKRL